MSFTPNVRNAVNVLTDFGAKPDGTKDNTTAIQNAVNAPNARTIFFPKGTGDYLMSGTVRLKPNQRIMGEGGYHDIATGQSATIRGTNGQPLFDFDGIDFVEIDHLGFAGDGCSAIRQEDITTGLLVNSHIHHCNFQASLAECIYAVLQGCSIYENTFGYFGTPGATHRHIFSDSHANTNYDNNLNHIRKNLFYKAKGALASIYMDGGAVLCLEQNDFETNLVSPLILNGLETIWLINNWFENNNATYYVQCADATAPKTGLNNTVVARGNEWAAHANTTHLFSATGTFNLYFEGNAGTGMSGKYITNYGGNDNGIVTYLTNRMIGYSRANSDVTKRTSDSVTAHGETNSAAPVTGDGTVYKNIKFDVVDNNNANNNFDVATGTLAVQTTGNYAFNIMVGLNGIGAAHTTGYIELVTTTQTYRQIINPYNMANAAGQLVIPLSIIAFMNAGNTAYVNVMVANGAKSVSIYGGSITQRTNCFSAGRVFNA